MVFLKRFGQTVALMGNFAKLAKIANSLQEESDGQKIIRMCGDVEDCAARIESSEVLASVAAKAGGAAVIDAVQLALLGSRSARCYVTKDFAGALIPALLCASSARPAIEFGGVNYALISLAQAKLQMLKTFGAEAYDKEYGLLEIEIMASANRLISSANPFAKKDGESASVKASEPFHNLAMSAAQLAFVGGDLLEAYRWIDGAIVRTGAKIIIQREIDAPVRQFWFYDNVDQGSQEDFRQLLSARVSLAIPSSSSTSARSTPRAT